MELLFRVIRCCSWFALVGWCVVAAVGCYNTQSAPPKLGIDPSSATDQAFEQLDANHDGFLTHEEAAGCPALAESLKDFDGDKDGRVSTDEMEAEISSWINEMTRMVTVVCEVTLDGKPLGGGTIRFVPVSFLGDGMYPAVGSISDSGMSRVGIEQENLPADLAAGLKGVQPGLYRVEITNPQKSIPATYNTDSILGCHVTRNTSQRAVRFALKSH